VRLGVGYPCLRVVNENAVHVVVGPVPLIRGWNCADG
jgi:hypothetical protein